MIVDFRQVLLVEDDVDMRTAIAQSLELDGYGSIAVGSATEALARLEHGFPGVIVTDILMPGITGLQLFERVRALDPDLPVILITGHGNVDLAVTAMKDGAYDFISKPFAPDRLLEAVRRAMEKRALVLENRRLREVMAAGSDDALTGETNAIRQLRETIRQLADTNVDVLVEGETGSGKEVVARLLHRWSRRRDRPFVAINCGALPETMIESELFGHEAGAFTGAQKRRIGLTEHSSGGTLFLDEIESMPPSLQVKFLRVLETRQIAPLGTNEVRNLNLRVVAATKTDFSNTSTRGEFRSDLYFRLSVFTLKIPPLRERREDIPLLFGALLRRAESELGLPVPELTSAAKTHLDTHGWPGNVRELLNFARRFVVLGRVPGAGPESHPSLPSAAVLGLAERVDRFEADCIRDALRDAGGDVRRACEILQLPRKTFYDKLKRHGISSSEFKPPEGE